MATYSRTSSISQTTQTATQVAPSKDLSSVIVKSLENIINENDDKDSDEKLQETIKKAIDESDFGKQSKDNSKDLNELLKNKNQTKSDSIDKDLANLLKKSNTDKSSYKAKSVQSKSKSPAAIGAGIVGAIMGGKLLGKGLGAVGNATAGIFGGAGKIAGGTLSLIGKTLGGSIGGAVGNVVGGVVGGAISGIGKLVGGAIGGLGKLLTTPLKEIVSKGTLIVGVASQLFVFLEGLLAKYMAEKDLKLIDFMAKLESNIKVIPDKIRISFEQLFSKVRIMGQPIFGSLSKDEEKELKNLEKDKDMQQYGMALEEIELSNEKLQKQQDWLQTFANNNLAGTGRTMDVSQFDLSSEEGRQAYKQSLLANASYDLVSKDELSKSIDEQLKDYKLAALDNESKKDYAKFLETSGPDSKKIQRYLELKEKSESPLTQEYFDKQQEEIDTKKDRYYSQSVQRGLEKQMAKGDLTAREAQTAVEKYGWGSELAAAGVSYSNTYNKDYQFAPATGAEKFLDNQYKAWTDSWSKLFKDFTTQVGIKIEQKKSVPNPVIGMGGN